MPESIQYYSPFLPQLGLLLAYLRGVLQWRPVPTTTIRADTGFHFARSGVNSMAVIEFGRRRIFFFIVSFAIVALFLNLSWFYPNEIHDRIEHLSIPGHPKTSAKPTLPVNPPTFPSEDDLVPPPAPTPSEVPDTHPISALMEEADKSWRIYEGSRSLTFRQTVEKYRSKYGRHPPPGFKDWYMFARKKNVFNIDDFDQIMDDLRPFWAVDPKIIRTYAAHMWEKEEHAVAGIHIRNHKIAKTNSGNWRTETMVKMIEKVIEYLPDMDIAMNRLDQPRVVVPWDDMQALLTKEYETRTLPPASEDSFTSKQDFLLNLTVSTESDTSERLDANWFFKPGQLYMKIASQACPPDSPARNPNMSAQQVNLKFKEPLAGLVSNFNLSTDLCTVGEQLSTMHGLLYSASSIIASHTLVPIFGECKVNVNSDILFPANMYYKHDDRYEYSDAEDVPWAQKDDTMIWRGVTSGGVQIEENWETMHRQRLVRLLNGTFQDLNRSSVRILTQSPATTALTSPGEYEPTFKFKPSSFAKKHTDVGFVEAWGCVPNCSFYKDVFSWKPQTSLTSQFRSKYLIDVDGHSFSGRWHAFLQSQSLGFKATIFREWHDSRLFAWRHFVPVDNRYDDLYSLLTYFIGVGKKVGTGTGTGADMLDDFEDSDSDADATLNPGIFVPSHDATAQKLANQGREWANKVLRREDIEVYMFRLLLEYGRVCDDNRDRIGYSGDGSELDKFDAELGKDGGSLWGIGSLVDKAKGVAKGWTGKGGG